MTDTIESHLVHAWRPAADEKRAEPKPPVGQMTAVEHYCEAERLLAVLDVEADPKDWEASVADGSVAVAIAAAQVHATLALAGASVFGALVSIDQPSAERNHWANAVLQGPADKRRGTDAG